MGLFDRRPAAIESLDLRPAATISEVTALRQEVAALRELTEARKTQVISASQARIDRASAQGGQPNQEPSRLYDAYLACPWLSAPIDTIAARMTSGGFTLEPAPNTTGNAAGKEQIQNLFLYCNDEEDMVEMCQMAIRAVLIFGEAYWEIVEANRQPHELYTISPLTMQPIRNDQGIITSYLQVMPDGQKIPLTTEQVLRFPLRGPMGETLSPIKKLLASATAYNFISDWMTHFFQYGAKPPFQIVLGEDANYDDAMRYMEDWEETYAGAENAHRVPVMYNGAEIKPLTTQGHLEMDFLQTVKYLREEFLAVLGVPPSAINVSDNGNRLTDMSESADKQFRYNTINPLRKLIEEKITYRIIQQGFGIHDWVFKLKEEDYRADADILSVITQQVGYGLLSIDEANALLGREQKTEGGDVHFIAVPSIREVTPISDLAHIHSSQYVQAQQTAITTGLDPHAQPEDLAQASPRDPSKTGPAHPVAVQDQQFQQKAQKGPPQKDDKESVSTDLARWQRVALKALKEGKPQRVFESEHIDAATYWAVAEGLSEATSLEAIRATFDAAFAAVREDRPWLSETPS